jgi:hypothetical protein
MSLKVLTGEFKKLYEMDYFLSTTLSIGLYSAQIVYLFNSYKIKR